MSNAAIVSWLSQAEFHLVDPGDAGALPNDDYGIVPLVTTGVQTRTLQQPDHAGLRLIINMVTDGGNCTITVAGPGYDVFGSTTMVFSAVGQYIELIAVDRAPATPVWRVVSYDGVTGPSILFATLTVATGLAVTGSANFVNANFSGIATVEGLFTVNDAAAITGMLSCNGITCTAASTFTDTVAFSDPVTMTSTLAVTGAATLSGATTVDDTLSVTGTSTLVAVNAGGKLTLTDGGTVTQTTSTTTGVTLNTNSGQITTFSSTLAAGGEESFTVTNSVVAALDVPKVVIASTSSAGTPDVCVDRVAAGSFRITVTNKHVTDALNNTMVINFVVVGGASS